MHPEVEKLLKLQETDLQVQYYSGRIELLPKQLAELEAKLNGTLQSLESNKQKIVKAASDKKKMEGNIQDLEQKNSKYRGQLTDVKTNEQYKALLHEIEFNEKEVRKIEDGILALMEQEEELRKESQAIQQQLQKEKALVVSEKTAAEAEVARDGEILSELQSQREAVMRSVDPAVLQTYRQIAKFRKGLALARATQDSCQACHVRIRPHVVSQVMSGDLIITCDSCSRILYWKPDAPYEATS
ncbi:MAG: C4-type zinc ribbon domain-containing protein [Acidobacteria bacterium]|nr:C4-type zinc ribbon domain-containing protein [Acidobacteriota bacterium]MCI0626851.1 C4-type zinc ribbon domain-containing protein [Acidobacteriota bacterium]MCI0722099.1 C4-type zinc ribbon domain-containing protein [Acidobacteriota bacterium]